MYSGTRGLIACSLGCVAASSSFSSAIFSHEEGGDL